MTVAVEGLTKVYPGASAPAVDDVSFEASPGEFLVLLGPSGCGKTTLLRTIAGLEKATSGVVRINGEIVDDLPPRARRIAMVFQSYALYPHRTVRQNIEFPLRASKVPAGKRAEKVAWAAQLLALERLLDRRPRQLSGGERQRVALARALVREPAAFLLDEPLSNLDAKLRAQARGDLKDFQQRMRTTTVYVTHDQAEAMGMGDRIAVMHEGRIRQIGSPHEIYDEPADAFVATFLGTPPMTLVPRDGELVGFRPENAVPALANDPPTFTLDVRRVEFLSGDRHVHGTVHGLGEPAPGIVRLPATVTTPVEPGGRYGFVVPSKHLCVFDAASGKRK